MNVIARALADLAQPAHEYLLTPEPPDDRPTRRGLRPAPPDLRRYGTLTAEEGTEMIRNAATTYLSEESPAHALLIAAPAGLGKTTLGVELAERYAAGGGRVLYLGPRRDFFDDLVPMMRQPTWWYNWQPRTIGKGQGVGQTCRYAPQIAAWMQRGYPAMTFCTNPRICGWAHVHDGCPWHAQARSAPAIIFGQYEHLSLGHPLLRATGLIIGDELPLRAFLHPWHIPAADVVPGEMEDGPRLTVMRGLRRLCAEAPLKGLSGTALLDALGGAEYVAEACKDVPLAELEAPELRHADAAEQAPYAHLFRTLSMLYREADAARNGIAAIGRVQIDATGLTLLLRRTPPAMPPHVIWLDATASAPLYRTLLGRPVEVVAPDVRMTGTVHQVWSSLNSKRHLVTGDESPKLDHLQSQVGAILDRGYQAPAVVTYKDLVAHFCAAGHFHGSRGTNRMADCDCLIVIGTPQPSADDLLTTATMVYDRRTAPFDTTWTTQDRPYAGQPWAYPTSGFWNDLDLQVLLDQLRESELIQALHRARPIRRTVDVYLLTNLPLPGIPVQLLSLHALFGAPEGVDPYRWPEVRRTAEARMEAVGRVTTQDFSLGLGADNRTAAAWIDGLIAQGWHEIDRVPSATRGRPVRAICKEFATT